MNLTAHDLNKPVGRNSALAPITAFAADRGNPNSQGP